MWKYCFLGAYIKKYDIVSSLKQDRTFLLNSPWNTIEQLEAELPTQVKKSNLKIRAQNKYMLVRFLSIGTKERNLCN